MLLIFIKEVLFLFSKTVFFKTKAIKKSLFNGKFTVTAPVIICALQHDANQIVLIHINTRHPCHTHNALVN